jgi:calcium/calmodulin-dependent protein kinase I
VFSEDEDDEDDDDDDGGDRSAAAAADSAAPDGAAAAAPAEPAEPVPAAGAAAEEEVVRYNRAEVEAELAGVSALAASMDGKIEEAVEAEDYDLADSLNTELTELRAKEALLQERLALCGDENEEGAAETAEAPVAEQQAAEDEEEEEAASVALDPLPTSFEETYTLGEKLGAGTFSTVHEATHAVSGNKVAVKVVQKAALTAQDAAALEQEIAILREMEHPNILKLHEHFQDDGAHYLVTELLAGGELFDRVVEKEFYSEREARGLVRLLLDAVQYCHGHGVVHRDLKPENLLLTSYDDDLNIKIGDFGFATHAVAGLTAACGTPGYVAPEILEGEAYGTPVDIWAVGVITYILLCGYPPFHDDDQAALFALIKKGAYEFESPYWDHVTEDAKGFLRRMLVVDAGARATASELLDDAWIVGDHVPNTHLESAITELKSFNARRKFRAAVKTVQTIRRLSTLIAGGGGAESDEPSAAAEAVETEATAAAEAEAAAAEAEAEAEAEAAAVAAQAEADAKADADAAAAAEATEAEAAAAAAAAEAAEQEALAQAASEEEAKAAAAAALAEAEATEAADMQKIMEEAEAAALASAAEVDGGVPDELEGSDAAPASADSDSGGGGGGGGGDDAALAAADLSSASPEESVQAAADGGGMFGGMTIPGDAAASAADEPEAAVASAADGDMFGGMSISE